MRLIIRNPDVGSVTCCRVISETSREKIPMPARRGPRTGSRPCSGQGNESRRPCRPRDERAGEQAARICASIVLPIAVDLNGDVVAVLLRVDVAGLHRSADSEVERESEDRWRRLPQRVRRAVRGAVVDNDDVEIGRPLLDLSDRGGDRLPLRCERGRWRDSGSRQRSLSVLSINVVEPTKLRNPMIRIAER